MPSEVDQNSSMYYIDAIEHFGLAPDVCPEPATECGVAVTDDYAKVGKCYVTSSMPCDGAVQQTALMTRYLKGSGKQAACQGRLPRSRSFYP